MAGADGRHHARRRARNANAAVNDELLSYRRRDTASGEIVSSVPSQASQQARSERCEPVISDDAYRHEVELGRAAVASHLGTVATGIPSDVASHSERGGA